MAEVTNVQVKRENSGDSCKFHITWKFDGQGPEDEPCVPKDVPDLASFAVSWEQEGQWLSQGTQPTASERHYDSEWQHAGIPRLFRVRAVGKSGLFLGGWSEPVYDPGQ